MELNVCFTRGIVYFFLTSLAGWCELVLSNYFAGEHEHKLITFSLSFLACTLILLAHNVSTALSDNFLF